MKGAVAVVKMLSAVCVLLLVHGQSVLAQKGASTEPTKTIVADLLDIDRDLYIVRGERGEIQIEATYKTEVTEEFEYGDRIKALVLMNNKALKIERAGPDDVPGVVENKAATAKAPVLPKEGGDKAAASAPPQQPDRKTIVGDLLDVDRDLYIVRGERGEIQIEATYKTEMTEEFQFGDRIKALVLMNNKALKIERAGPMTCRVWWNMLPLLLRVPIRLRPRPRANQAGTAAPRRRTLQPGLRVATPKLSKARF